MGKALAGLGHLADRDQDAAELVQADRDVLLGLCTGRVGRRELFVDRERLGKALAGFGQFAGREEEVAKILESEYYLQD